MHILMMTDLEGVAGVARFDEQTYADGRYHDDAKRLLTAEVNATVEGLIEAGATAVTVIDGHGPGGMRFEDLESPARLLHGRPLPRRWVTRALEGVEAAVMVGMHAMAGTPDGTLNHTMNSRSIAHYRLNGREIGEIAMFALACGAVGAPVLLVSGDRAACREAEALLPDVATCAVKEGLGRTAAISLSAEEARSRLRESAEQALRAHMAEARAPLVWPGPFELDRCFFTTAQADQAEKHEGAERIDPLTVRHRSDDILDLMFI